MKNKSPSVALFLQSRGRDFNVPEEYLRRTVEVFKREMGRPVSREEAIEIATNVLNYLAVLVDADENPSDPKPYIVKSRLE